MQLVESGVEGLIEVSFKKEVREIGVISGAEEARK